MVEDPVALVARVKARLDAIQVLQPGEPYGDWRARMDRAVKAAMADLAQAGAFCKHDWQGAVFKFAGIRSTCTSSFGGALGNWLRRAREKQAQDA